MRFSVLGVPVTSMGMSELLDGFDSGFLMFHNLDTLNKVRGHDEFREVCRRADFAVIDGQVLRGVLSTLFRSPTDKVSGSDFLPQFCVHHRDDSEVGVFLLGAGPGVAERAKDALNRRAGRDVVVGAHSPSFDLLDDEEESRHVAELVNRSGADTLAVGLGAPKQELWLARHRDLMPSVRRVMAVGATLDFAAGRVRRAPAWMSRWGLEWAFRLAVEPRRLWRRYLVEGPTVVWAMATDQHRSADQRTTNAVPTTTTEGHDAA